MSDSKEAASGGIGVCGLLGVAFVVLKLCNVIDWSWWWVTAPFWGGAAFFLTIMVAIVVCVLVAALYDAWKCRRQRKLRRR